MKEVDEAAVKASSELKGLKVKLFGEKSLINNEAIEFSTSNTKRLQHAYKHASDLGFGNWNKENSKLWKEYISDNLKNATKTFDNTLGNDAVKGYYRNIKGNDVAIYIYKEGTNKGLVASVVKLSKAQMKKFGLE